MSSYIRTKVNAFSGQCKEASGTSVRSFDNKHQHLKNRKKQLPLSLTMTTPNCAAWIFRVEILFRTLKVLLTSRVFLGK